MINTKTIKVHECTDCGYSSPYKNTLKVHMMKEHGKGEDKDKPYQCHLCPYQTYYRGNLEKHVRIHTGERPYQCRFCGKQFSSQSNKKSHENRHQGFHKLKCPYQSCGYFTNKVQEMSGHLATAHPGGPLTVAFGGAAKAAALGSESAAVPKRVDLKIPSRKSNSSSGSPVEGPSSSQGVSDNQEVFTEDGDPKKQRENKLLNFLASQMTLGIDRKPQSAGILSLQPGEQNQLPPISSFHNPNANKTLLPWQHMASQLQQAQEGRHSVISMSSDEGVGVDQHMEEAPRYESRYDSRDIKPNLEELALQAVEQLTKQINRENAQAQSSDGYHRLIGSSPSYKISPDISQVTHVSSLHQDSQDYRSDQSSAQNESEDSGSETRRKSNIKAEESVSGESPTTTYTAMEDDEAKETIDRLITLGRLFRCSHCNILFPEYSMFVFHMGCHGESNPYQCHFCKVNFADKFGFLAHFMQCYKY